MPANTANTVTNAKAGPCAVAASGLTQQEAHARLRSDGYNELPAARRRDIAVISLEVVREPMFLLLLISGGLYLLLGDVREALLLLFFVFVVAMPLAAPVRSAPRPNTCTIAHSSPVSSR